MRVVVIGSSGFIGTNLVEYLNSRQLDVVACDIREPVKRFEGVNYHKVTGDEAEYYGNVIEAGDYVVLLRWKGVSVSAIKNQQELFRSNIVENVLLIDLCVKRKAGKIVFASSGGAVYGNKDVLPISEREDVRPISEYGVQKLMIEEYLGFISRTSGIPTLCLRIANPFGPYQPAFSGQGIIATFLASCLQGKSVEIWGDGNCLRDYLYVDDLCECVCRCLLEDIGEGVYNIGSGIGTSILQICEAISEVTGAELRRTMRAAYATQVKDNVLDSTKIKEQIGWECRISMAEGIARMCDCWNGRGFLK